MLRTPTLPMGEVEGLVQEVRGEINHPKVLDVRLREFTDSVWEPALEIMLIVKNESASARVDVDTFMRFASDLRERIAAEGDERWVYPWIGTESNYKSVMKPYVGGNE